MKTVVLPSLLLALPAFLMSIRTPQAVAAEPAPAQLQAGEIGNRTIILGYLGHPIGEELTIHGKKLTHLPLIEFRVDTVNDKKLERSMGITIDGIDQWPDGTEATMRGRGNSLSTHGGRELRTGRSQIQVTSDDFSFVPSNQAFGAEWIEDRSKAVSCPAKLNASHFTAIANSPVDRNNSNFKLTMPTPEPKRRWFHLSPDRFVILLLLVIGLLWLSDRFQWFGFNHHKGWTVLIAVAAVGVAALVMLTWWAVSLIVRWRFQFGIRSLLVFCMASSIAAGWLAVEKEKAGEQRRAVEEIWISRGWTKDDWEFNANRVFATIPEPPGPSWLRNLLGIDFFSVVVFIHLDGTDFTDGGVEHFTSFAQLEELSLFGTPVTDAGVKHLMGFARLAKLNPAGTAVTHAGLEYLARLPSLKELILHDTNVTDVGLAHLAGITQLESLDLSSTLIADPGLSHLRELTLLQILKLKGDRITDAGLERLEQLTQLREVDLVDTLVSNAGVAKLQSALPHCTISHWPEQSNAQMPVSSARQTGS